MNSGKPLVLVVNRRSTVKPDPAKRGPACHRVRQRPHLRLVAADGAALPRRPDVSPESAPAEQRRVAEPRPGRSLSRPLGQRVARAANDVAVLALALLSGLRPRA